MPPRVIAHEPPQLFVGLYIGTRKLFVLDELQSGRQLANKLDTFHYRIQVLTGLVGTLFEVMEIHTRRHQWISRLQRYFTGTIQRMGFEDGPGQAVMFRSEELGVAWKVAVKVAHQAKAEKVR